MSIDTKSNPYSSSKINSNSAEFVGLMMMYIIKIFKYVIQNSMAILHKFLLLLNLEYEEYQISLVKVSQYFFLKIIS